ncbi:L,D-transpeptidase family protein [Methylomonas montana]|uniref:L,D-transpeptidase family protein n=1 Tax=Methylomonas montana TaxID=3058963 RepID=UPI002659E445|nr:L,D-transpeptidase family protein [Methylomonas montana]WKJ90346.1 L,D-transpeptidase family protein [Methylomonas montana]
MKKTTAIFLIAIPVLSHAEFADLITISKSEKVLYLQKQGRVFAAYPVAFGRNPIGHKEKQGDNRTPEGAYTIDARNENSSYFKALHISYPNSKDIDQARVKGVSAGGDIMIHGQKNGFGWASFLVQHFNWTRGCVALSNDNMEKVWQSVNVGAKIEIKP